jgi:hypothetical protein
MRNSSKDPTYRVGQNHTYICVYTVKIQRLYRAITIYRVGQKHTHMRIYNVYKYMLFVYDHFVTTLSNS